MTVSNEAVEAARRAIPEDETMAPRTLRATLEAAASFIAAQALEDAAKELAQLPYVRPAAPGRNEYVRLLAVRRGNADGWLLTRAAALRGQG